MDSSNYQAAVIKNIKGLIMTTNSFHSKSLEIFNEQQYKHAINPETNINQKSVPKATVKIPNSSNAAKIKIKIKNLNNKLTLQTEQTNRLKPALKIKPTTENLMSEFKLLINPLNTTDASSHSYKTKQLNITSDKLNKSNLSMKIMDIDPFQNFQNFYIKKMNDFGFRDLRGLQSTNSFLSTSDTLLNPNNNHLIGKINKLKLNQYDFFDEALLTNKKQKNFDLFESSVENFDLYNDNNSLASNHQNSNLVQRKLSLNSSQNNENLNMSFTNVFSEVIRTRRKSLNNSKPLSSRNFSNSLIILPELDEQQMTTSSTGSKDSKSNNNSINISVMKNKKLGNNQKHLHNGTKQHSSMSNNRTSRMTNQSELTLPPIVESENRKTTCGIDSSSVNNENPSNANRPLGTHIISIGNNKNKWHLSPTNSDNDINASLNTPNETNNNNNENNNNNSDVIITTVEIVDQSNTLKKNATSSTLNSFAGKSSSIQSRLTATTNNSSINRFLRGHEEHDLNNHENHENSNKRYQLSIIASEQKYLESLGRLYSINTDPIDQQTHANTTKHVTIVANIEDQNTTKNNTHFNSNNIEIKQPLEQKLNENINSQNLSSSNSNINNLTIDNNLSSQNAPMTSLMPNLKTKQQIIQLTNRSSNFQKPDIYKEQFNSNNHTSLPYKSLMQRQLTTLTNNSNNNEFRKIPSSSVLSQQNHSKPVAKPRKIDNSNKQRSISLARQSTTENNNNQAIKHENNLSSKANKFFISTSNSNNKILNNKTNDDPNRPKTNLTNNNSGNQLVKNKLNRNNTQNEMIASLINQESKVIHISNSNSNNNDIVIENVNDEVLAKKPLFPPADETDDSAMEAFTKYRIVNWLKEIEKCRNMVKPSSQLAWTNIRNDLLNKNSDLINNNGNNHSNNKMSNEFNLSDFDSMDDQIIEYNRVVDKTFHIIHYDD